MMKKRYFKNKRTITRAKDSLRVDLSGRLSPYDELVKKYARQYGQDWRLITAQMYQESKFDPQAISWVGARGLMQIMPVTGRELGFTDLHDPEENIHAGVKYLSQLANRFAPQIPIEERMRFALAAYNVRVWARARCASLGARKGVESRQVVWPRGTGDAAACQAGVSQAGALRLLSLRPARALRGQHSEYVRRLCRDADYGEGIGPRASMS